MSTGTGQHLFLLSGWGTDALPMCDLGERLAPGEYTALGLNNLYNTANDTKSGDKTDLSVYARDLLNRMDAVPGPVNVLGWSTGGVIAMEVGRKRPERFNRLVLLSSTAKFCQDESYAHGVPVSALKSMMVGLKRSPKQVIETFFTKAATPLRLDEHQLHLALEVAMRQGVDPLHNGLRYLLDSDYREDLEKINCPALVIHGKHDRIIPVQAAQWVSETLPASELIVYPRGGHLLIAQHGHEIVPQIKAFLESNS